MKNISEIIVILLIGICIGSILGAIWMSEMYKVKLTQGKTTQILKGKL